MKAGIAGGGIMGRLIAFFLSHAGWDVTLFDQSILKNCSMAAAGLLTPVAELEKNELIIFQLGAEALNVHWPYILNKLPNQIYFQQSGSLLLSHPRDHSGLAHFIHLISSKLGHHDFYHRLNHDDICHLEPDAAKFSSGIYFANEGHIDSQQLMRVLKDYLIKRAIKWVENCIVSTVNAGEIISTNKTHKFDFVFDCRGLGAKTEFDDLRSVRGELIWLQAPDMVITRPIRFLHPRYSLYIVPRSNHIYLIGASEIESDDASNISVRTTLELLTATYYFNSKFSEARIIKTVTQCRPTLSNHLPRINYSDGLVRINGLYRHGFLIAPTLAHDIVNWLHDFKIVRHKQLWNNYS